jgi:hypothetical protein
MPSESLPIAVGRRDGGRDRDASHSATPEARSHGAGGGGIFAMQSTVPVGSPIMGTPMGYLVRGSGHAHVGAMSAAAAAAATTLRQGPSWQEPGMMSQVMAAASATGVGRASGPWIAAAAASRASSHAEAPGDGVHG